MGEVRLWQRGKTARLR